MYVSVRGWIDVAREQQDAVEAVIAAADRDLYSGGWTFPARPFNWSLYVFYGGSIREAALPWLREQVSLIAALPPVDEDGDMPVGLFVLTDERSPAVSVWEIRDGRVDDRPAPELACGLSRLTLPALTSDFRFWRAASVLVVDVPARFRPALADVVARLAALDYEGLKRDGIDPSPDDADLSMWIRNYGETGATIVPLPDVAWAKAEAWPIEAHPDQWFAVLDLWTQEEGMSDLSLEATVTESSGEVTVVIHNIHVL
jgi:hypothetical protein